ncbi:MAG: 30S ribosomal protein S20 [bacterium]
MAEKKKVVKRKGIKNVRQTKKRRARNIKEKDTIKKAIKAARTAITGKIAEAADKLKQVVSILDKAAERGIIHANKAARLKSRLMIAFNKNK